MLKPLLLATAAVLALAACGVRTPAFSTPVKPTAMAAKALDPAKFFARPETQALMPEAFSLQPAALPALQALAETTQRERLALVKAIQADPALKAGLKAFPTLTWEERLPLLKRVMALECTVMGITAPPLVLGEGDQRSAFFDFDPDHPDTGRVILYPAGLAQEENPYAALLLLVHETRHSAQFQMAHDPARTDAIARSFKAAFRAQKQLAGKMSFCDFCSLVNEYEAFQSANFIIGTLTDWQVDTHDMGCLSSQYDGRGHLKIDLLDLAKRVGPAQVLSEFNRLEKPQFERLGGR